MTDAYTSKANRFQETARLWLNAHDYFGSDKEARLAAKLEEIARTEFERGVLAERNRLTGEPGPEWTP